MNDLAPKFSPDSAAWQGSPAAPYANPVHVFERAGLGKAPFHCIAQQRATYQACPGAPIQPGTTCDFCFTGISNVFVIQSSDGRKFKVGCDCVAKTGDAGLIKQVRERRLANAREQRAAKRAVREAGRKARIEAEREARRDASLAQGKAFWATLEISDADLVAGREHARVGHIVRDLHEKCLAVGSLTEAQVGLVKRLISEANEVSKPAPIGKVTFRGVIQTTKVNDYGQLKCLVRADDGYKVWCTLPAGVLQSVEVGRDGRMYEARGKRVEIKATLEVSRDDATFAFAKRPSGKLISE
jgi:hypothetical protein